MTACMQACGNTTPEICPPEVAKHWRDCQHKHTAPPLISSTAMDMWSLGCVLYTMVTHRHLLCDLAGWEQSEMQQRNPHEAMEVGMMCYDGKQTDNSNIHVMKPISYQTTIK